MTEFEEIPKILNFWFPKPNTYQEFWFDGQKDAQIIEQFSNLVQKAGNNELDEWLRDKYGKLALIILLDQFTRNIFRGTSKMYKNDDKAYLIAKQILDTNEDFTYTIQERIFILLPLRHQKQAKLLKECVKRIYMYENLLDTINDELESNIAFHKEDNLLSTIQMSETIDEQKNLLRRFKLATFRDFSKTHDDIIVYDFVEDVSQLNYIDWSDILDDTVMVYSSELLDKECKNHLLYQTIYNFLRKNYDNLSSSSIAVSLSGGVDSMCMAYILNEMKKNGIIKDIVCIHLYYGNRKDSMRETDFIIRWCQFYKIKLYFRKITHMKRPSNIDNVCGDSDITREFYEEETKNIRLALYKYVQEELKIIGTCLGHHKDDISETVFMNFVKGRDIMDLQVMKPFMEQDGAIMIRPMLEQPKSVVYDFASQFYIPFTKDTTPHWSCRGVMRRQLFPKMKEQFGEGVMENMVYIGRQSEEWKTIIDNLIMQPLFESIQYKEHGIVINIKNDMLKMTEVFWNRVLVHVFHNSGNHMISHKNTREFIKFLNLSRDNLFRFSNGFTCTLQQKTPTDYKLYLTKSSGLTRKQLIQSLQ